MLRKRGRQSKRALEIYASALISQYYLINLLGTNVDNLQHPLPRINLHISLGFTNLRFHFTLKFNNYILNQIFR